MVHLDLFSGLGLFSYAADHVWDLEHVFCEIEDWPYKFLKQEYPNARIERDIKTFDGTEYSGRTFLLTASFPCQPISTAGKREGTEDDRWLWPQTITIARCVQPEWVIFENVAGLTSLAEQYSASKMENKTVQRLAESDLYEKIFSQQEILSLGIIIDDIEKAGFELPKLIDGTPVVLCVPACAIGAVHERNRVWIVACNTNKKGLQGAYDNPESSNGIQQKSDKRHRVVESENASNSQIARSGELSESERRDDAADIDGENQDVANAKSKRFGTRTRGELDYNSNEYSQHNRGEGETARRNNSTSEEWSWDWPEVATELCGMDVSSTDRVHRLKALGNTIQWEVAYELMQGIANLPTS